MVVTIEKPWKFDLARKAAFTSLLALAIFPAVAEVPFCALRFGYRFTQPDKWPEMRAEIGRASCRERV